MFSINDLNVGDVRVSMSGDEYEILSINGCKDIKVRFITTGSIRSFRSVEISDGYIKDLYKPAVYGVGYVGSGPFNGISNKKAKRAWSGMLERCYSVRLHSKHPTYIGCTVCDEWHNFQNFAEWYESNYPDDGGVYHLDKDIKVKGNKVYSPSTCLFVSPSDNAICATAARYRFTNPDGVDLEIYNLTNFCRENGLTPANMIKVVNGERRHHKGYSNGVKL